MESKVIVNYKEKSDEAIKLMAGAYVDRHLELPKDLQEEVNKRYLADYDVDLYTPSRDGYIQFIGLGKALAMVVTDRKSFSVNWNDDAVRKQFMMGITSETTFYDKRVVNSKESA